VSAHLAVLRSAGLVTAGRHRHEVLYRQTSLADALIASCATP
jgi:DNA-binding transcriptional ArsR family regulator